MQTDTPGDNFLPSEICRLVLGFLKGSGYMNTYHCFLKECEHLREYNSLLRKGKEYPTTIMGLSLLMMLDDYARLKLMETSVVTGVHVIPSTSSTPPQRLLTSKTLPQNVRSRTLHRAKKNLPSRFLSDCRSGNKTVQTVNSIPIGVSTNIKPLSLFANSNDSSEESDIDVGVDIVTQVPQVPNTSTPAGSSAVVTANSAILNLEQTPVSCVSSNVSNTSGFQSDTSSQVNSKQSDSQVLGLAVVSQGIHIVTQVQEKVELTGGGVTRVELPHHGTVDESFPSDVGASMSSTFHRESSSLSSVCLPQSTDQVQPSSNESSSLVVEEDHGQCDQLSSKDSASKRRKKTPRRRSEAGSHEAAGGGGGRIPLNKIINSSRFVKNLVDNINNCLYDSQKHQSTPASGKTSVADAGDDKQTVAPESVSAPSTSGTVTTHDNSLDEEFDFLNKEMTEDTMSNIIDMASSDPLFDELFDIFNSDREEFIQMHSGKAKAVPEGLHTPPHSSETEADYPVTDSIPPLTAPSVSQHLTTPLTSASSSVTGSHPATLSFSTEYIDLNSMSGFPFVGDLPEEQDATTPSSNHHSLSETSNTESSEAGKQHSESKPGSSNAIVEHSEEKTVKQVQSGTTEPETSSKSAGQQSSESSNHNYTERTSEPESSKDFSGAIVEPDFSEDRHYSSHETSEVVSPKTTKPVADDPTTSKISDLSEHSETPRVRINKVSELGQTDEHGSLPKATAESSDQESRRLDFVQEKDGSIETPVLDDTSLVECGTPEFLTLTATTQPEIPPVEDQETSNVVETVTRTEYAHASSGSQSEHTHVPSECVSSLLVHRETTVTEGDEKSVVSELDGAVSVTSNIIQTADMHESNCGDVDCGDVSGHQIKTDSVHSDPDKTKMKPSDCFLYSKNLESSVTQVTLAYGVPSNPENVEALAVQVTVTDSDCVQKPLVDNDSDCVEKPVVDNDSDCVEEPVVDNDSDCVEEPVVDNDSDCVEEPVVDNDSDCVEEPVVDNDSDCVEEPVVDNDSDCVEEPVVDNDSDCVEEPVVDNDSDCVEEPVVDNDSDCVEEPVVDNDSDCVEEPVVDNDSDCVEEPVVDNAIIYDDHNYCRGDEDKTVQGHLTDVSEDHTVSVQGHLTDVSEDHTVSVLLPSPDTPQVSESMPISSHNSRLGQLAMSAALEEASVEGQEILDGTRHGVVVVRNNTCNRSQPAGHSGYQSPSTSNRVVSESDDCIEPNENQDSILVSPAETPQTPKSEQSVSTVSLPRSATLQYAAAEIAEKSQLIVRDPSCSPSELECSSRQLETSQSQSCPESSQTHAMRSSPSEKMHSSLSEKDVAIALDSTLSPVKRCSVPEVSQPSTESASICEALSEVAVIPSTSNAQVQQQAPLLSCLPEVQSSVTKSPQFLRTEQPVSEYTGVNNDPLTAQQLLESTPTSYSAACVSTTVRVSSPLPTTATVTVSTHAPHIPAVVGVPVSQIPTTATITISAHVSTTAAITESSQSIREKFPVLYSHLLSTNSCEQNLHNFFSSSQATMVVPTSRGNALHSAKSVTCSKPFTVSSCQATSSMQKFQESEDRLQRTEEKSEFLVKLEDSPPGKLPRERMQVSAETDIKSSVSWKNVLLPVSTSLVNTHHSRVSPIITDSSSEKSEIGVSSEHYVSSSSKAAPTPTSSIPPCPTQIGARQSPAEPCVSYSEHNISPTCKGSQTSATELTVKVSEPPNSCAKSLGRSGARKFPVKRRTFLARLRRSNRMKKITAEALLKRALARIPVVRSSVDSSASSAPRQMSEPLAQEPLGEPPIQESLRHSACGKSASVPSGRVSAHSKTDQRNYSSSSPGSCLHSVHHADTTPGQADNVTAEKCIETTDKSLCFPKTPKRSQTKNRRKVCKNGKHEEKVSCVSKSQLVTDSQGATCDKTDKQENECSVHDHPKTLQSSAFQSNEESLVQETVDHRHGSHVTDQDKRVEEPVDPGSSTSHSSPVRSDTPTKHPATPQPPRTPKSKVFTLRYGSPGTPPKRSTLGSIKPGSPGTPKRSSLGSPMQGSPRTPKRSSLGSPILGSPRTPKPSSLGSPMPGSPRTPKPSSLGSPMPGSPGTPKRSSLGSPMPGSPRTPKRSSLGSPVPVSPGTSRCSPRRLHGDAPQSPHHNLHTPQHKHGSSGSPRTPRRSPRRNSRGGTPQSPHHDPHTPSRSAHTPFYSPIKSPYSPGTAAVVNSLFSPRRKKLINEPIPEEVLEEISLHSDSNLSDAQIVSRPGSVCACPVGAEGEDSQAATDVNVSILSSENQTLHFAHKSSGRSFQEVNSDTTPVISAKLSELSHCSESNHSLPHKESSDNSEVHPTVDSLLESRETDAASSNKSGLDGDAVRKENNRDTETISVSSDMQDFSQRRESEPSSDALDRSTSSSLLKNFRVVGSVHESVVPQPLTVAPVTEQQQGKLINVGKMISTGDDSSRHSVTIFSTHVTVQPTDRVAGKDGKADKAELSVDDPKLKADSQKDKSLKDIFISAGVGEETCKTNISMPILPLGVTQFLNNQIEMGELQVSVDFTADLTLQKTPTTSTEEEIVRHPSSRESTERLQPHSAITCESRSCSGKDKSPRKAATRKAVTTKESKHPRKGKEIHLDSKTNSESSIHQPRHFASVSEQNSPEQGVAGPDHSVQNILSTGVTKVTSRCKASKYSRRLKAPYKPAVKKLREAISKKDRHERCSPESDFSVHTSTDSDSFSSDDNLPLSEVAKKATQGKSELVMSSTDHLRTNLPLIRQNPEASEKDQRSFLSDMGDIVSSSYGFSVTHLETVTQEGRSKTDKEVVEPSKSVALTNVTADPSPKQSVIEQPPDPVSVQTAVEQPVSSQKPENSLPPKKRSVGKKNLYLLKPDTILPNNTTSNTTDEENTDLTLSQKFDEKASGKTNSDNFSFNMDMEHEHSSLSKRSHSGSSSIEVDVCELSDENVDEGSVVPQSVRKKKAIIAAKKSAKRLKGLAKSKRKMTMFHEGSSKHSLLAGEGKKGMKMTGSSSKHSHSARKEMSTLKKKKKKTARSSMASGKYLGNTLGALATADETKTVNPPARGLSPRRTAALEESRASLVTEPHHRSFPMPTNESTNASNVASSPAQLQPNHSECVTPSANNSQTMSSGGQSQADLLLQISGLSHPAAPSIQNFGPYRRIKPILISKTTTTPYFKSLRRSRAGIGQNLMEMSGSSGFLDFSAPSPATSLSEVSIGFPPQLASPSTFLSLSSPQEGVSAESRTVVPSAANCPVTETSSGNVKLSSESQAGCTGVDLSSESRVFMSFSHGDRHSETNTGSSAKISTKDSSDKACSGVAAEKKLKETQAKKSSRGMRSAAQKPTEHLYDKHGTDIAGKKSESNKNFAKTSSLSGDQHTVSRIHVDNTLQKSSNDYASKSSAGLTAEKKSNSKGKGAKVSCTKDLPINSNKQTADSVAEKKAGLKETKAEKEPDSKRKRVRRSCCADQHSVSEVHNDDNAQKSTSTKDSSHAGGKDNVDLNAKKKSDTKRKAAGRRSKKHSTGSAETKQKSVQSRGSKGRTRAGTRQKRTSMQSENELSTYTPYPGDVPVEEVESEIMMESASRQQACDSFETEEAVGALVGLNESGFHQNDDAVSVSTCHIERNQNIYKQLDRIPDDEADSGELYKQLDRIPDDEADSGELYKQLDRIPDDEADSGELYKQLDRIPDDEADSGELYKQLDRIPDDEADSGELYKQLDRIPDDEADSGELYKQLDRIPDDEADSGELYKQLDRIPDDEADSGELHKQLDRIPDDEADSGELYKQLDRIPDGEADSGELHKQLDRIPDDEADSGELYKQLDRIPDDEADNGEPMVTSASTATEHEVLDKGSPKAKISRKRKNVSPQKTSPKRTRKKSIHEVDIASQDNTDTGFAQSAKQMHTGMSESDITNRIADPTPALSVLSMPFLGEVPHGASEPLSTIVDLSQQQPANIVHFQERTSQTEEASEPDRQSQTVNNIDGSGIVNRFCHLLDQVEQDGSANNQRETNTVSEGVHQTSVNFESTQEQEPATETHGYITDNFQDVSVTKRQLEMTLGKSIIACSQVCFGGQYELLENSSLTKQQKLEQELKEMRIAKYMPRTLKNRQNKNKMSPKASVESPKKKRTHDELDGSSRCRSYTPGSVVPSIQTSSQVTVPYIQRQTSSQVTVPYIQRQTSSQVTVPYIQTQTSSQVTVPYIQRQTSSQVTVPYIQTQTSSQVTVPYIQTQTSSQVTVPVDLGVVQSLTCDSRKYRPILPRNDPVGNLVIESPHKAKKSRYQAILPVGGLGSLASVATSTNAPSTSNTIVNKVSINPLEAAMLSVLPELAFCKNTKHPSQSSQACEIEQIAHTPRVDAGAGIPAGSIDPQGVTTRRKPGESVNDNNNFSPQPIIIEDTSSSGTENSPAKLKMSRVGKQKLEAVQSTKQVSQEERANKRSSKMSKQKGTRKERVRKQSNNKNAGKNVRTQFDAVSVSVDDGQTSEGGRSECVLADVHVSSRPPEQSPVSAQQIFQHMMQPSLETVSMTENEEATLDHDALTALLPVSMLPPLSSISGDTSDVQILSQQHPFDLPVESAPNLTDFVKSPVKGKGQKGPCGVSAPGSKQAVPVTTASSCVEYSQPVPGPDQSESKDLIVGPSQSTTVEIIPQVQDVAASVQPTKLGSSSAFSHVLSFSTYPTVSQSEPEIQTASATPRPVSHSLPLSSSGTPLTKTSQVSQPAVIAQVMTQAAEQTSPSLDLTVQEPFLGTSAQGHHQFVTETSSAFSPPVMITSQPQLSHSTSVTPGNSKSPRQEVADILVSMDVIETGRKSIGVSGDKNQAEDFAKDKAATSLRKSSGKTGRLSSINIDKFLSDKVHK